MRFFRVLKEIFQSYDYRDKVLSVVGLVIILGMLVKMMVFPYGFFSFGESNIYTEGIISQNGIQSVNPLFTEYNEADREVSRLVFSGLMKYDPDKRAVVDDMATLTINEEKTEYTFVLKEGLKWQDGKDLTSDDVYFTFHDMVLAGDFSNEILRKNFAGVTVEQIDSSTVKFILEKPNAFFVTNMTIGILPKHILEKTSAFDLLQSDFNRLPIGSGPYMMEEKAEIFPDGRMQVTLTKNPYYYAESSEIEVMRIIVYQNMNQLLSEIDAVNGVVKISGDGIQDFVINERFTLSSYELPQYTAVFMNMESAVLKNEKVRLALQKAVDKKKLLEEFTDKIQVDTPLMELNQEEWVYQPNIDEANGALKDAGYTYAKDDTEHSGARYDSKGGVLELNLIALYYEEGTSKFEESKKVLKALMNAWESIGVRIKLELLIPGEFESRVSSRQYDLLFLGQSLGYNLDTYAYWHSSQASPLGLNLSNYKSFQVDTLIEDVRNTFDLTKREEKLKAIAEKIKEDIPAIFLYRPIYYYASDGKVSGVLMDGVAFASDRFSRINSWKFER